MVGVWVLVVLVGVGLAAWLVDVRSRRRDAAMAALMVSLLRERACDGEVEAVLAEVTADDNAGSALRLVR